jgi:hypothetical protein
MSLDLTDPRTSGLDAHAGAPARQGSAAREGSLAKGTRTRLTAAPPPIPAHVRRRTRPLPPPIPQRAARGTQAPQAPVVPRTQAMSGAVSVVAPRASAVQTASLQINPEAPLAAVRVGQSPSPSSRLTAMISGNAPEAIAANAAIAAIAASDTHCATPVVQAHVIPSPRESRVERLPTTQPGADVAELPRWPVRATLPAPSRGRVTVPPPMLTELGPAAATNISALDGSDRWVFEEDYEERRVDGEVVPTTYFERSEPARRTRSRWVIAAGAAAAVVALIVGLALHAPSDRAVSTPVAKPAPSRAPVAQAVAVPTPSERSSLPITSWPTGAIVTLVDNGAPGVLGPTPVTASLDPSRSYDVMLAVAGHPAKLRHIDLATMHELAVDFDADPPVEKLTARDPPVTAKLAARPPAPPAPAARPQHHSMPHAAIVTPAFDAPTAAPKPTQVALAAGARKGVLMISAKPPCEIIIDGRSTHLVTPQRSLALAAGAHVVTLVNLSIGIKKTISVKVDALKPTKLIQDFTKG